MSKNRKNLYVYIVMLSFFTVLILAALKGGMNIYGSGLVLKSHEASALSMFQKVVSTNLSSSFIVLLIQIIVILVACRLIATIFNAMNQPGVLGEIVAGILLGPSFLGHFWPQVSNFIFPVDSMNTMHLMSEIGLVLFMFVIGLEVDFSTLKTKMNETLVISHAGILVPFFLGILVSYGVYERYAATMTSFLPFALFIGIAMSITAFPVLARIIQEKGMTHSPLGVLTIASAANDDVTAWCLLAVVIAITEAGTLGSSIFAIVLTGLFILVMFVFVRPFFGTISKRFATRETINKNFISFVFLVVLLSATFTELIGIHALFGSFIAGVIMPYTHGFRRILIDKVEDITLAFFLPLFFAYSGLNTNVLLINNTEMWAVCGVFIVVAILGKFGGCAAAARVVGESWHDSLTIGILMNTRGLMQLVALNIGYELGVLPKSIYAVLVVMALVTTFMTVPCLNLFERIRKKKQIKQEKSQNIPQPQLNPKLMISFGRPESGSVLLYVYHLLFGKQLAEESIIASHFTQGTELSIITADHYSRDTFRFIDSEATTLKIQLDKHYKLSDNIVDEIVNLVNKEKADYLIVGSALGWFEKIPQGNRAKGMEHIHSLWKNIKEKSLELSGIGLTLKSKEILQRIKCNVMILVNQLPLNKISKVSIIICTEEDGQLLQFIDSLLQSVRQVRIYVSISLKGSELYKKIDNMLVENPAHIGFHPFNELKDLELNQTSVHFIITSYNVCREIMTTNDKPQELPAILGVRFKETK